MHKPTGRVYLAKQRTIFEPQTSPLQESSSVSGARYGLNKVSSLAIVKKRDLEHQAAVLLFLLERPNVADTKLGS